MTQSVNLFYNDFPDSGLGDRLIDVYLLSTIGYCIPGVSKVIIPWRKFQKYQAHHTVPEYRFTDIQLSNVLSHMNFPSNVIAVDVEKTSQYRSDLPVQEVNYCTNGSARWVSNLDTDRNLVRFHKELLAKIPYETVIRSSTRALSEFTFTENTTSMIGESCVQPYASVHIRRTDKVRSSKADDLMISNDELYLLNQKTFDAIECFAKERGMNTFYVCSDDEESAKPFIERIVKLGCRLISTPTVERWKTTFCDLAMMSKSDVIIQSQVSSVFSNMACLIGNTKLFNVLTHSPKDWK
jgi:hypothetical protein